MRRARAQEMNHKPSRLTVRESAWATDPSGFRFARGSLIVFGAAFVFAPSLFAQTPRHLASEHAQSITDNRTDWPTIEQVTNVLLLRSHNTRVVVIGTTLLGIAAGVVGTFAYLRKRALMGDALSHATLPGIAVVFLCTGTKNLALLITGAAASGVLGVLTVIAIRRYSRIKEDAAIGIVLSVFFGAGMVLFSIIQQMHTGNAAGLQSFIYGQTAALIQRDAYLIGGAALAVLIGIVALFKEFRVVCFDAEFAATQGWPVTAIDILMMALVVLTTVIGLQAVGLILVVALLIIPAAAARFWTDNLSTMTIIAGVFGALSGWIGSMISALAARLPAGAIIVMTAGAFFLISMFFAPRRGLTAAMLRKWLLNRRVAYQNLLRALAEFEEQCGESFHVKLHDLRAKRSWSEHVFRKTLDRAVRRGDVGVGLSGQVHLAAAGREQAKRVLRNHRLWEMYLIKYADIAPSHVDRDADEIEHVLSGELIRELEEALEHELRIPPSPHVEVAT